MPATMPPPFQKRRERRLFPSSGMTLSPAQIAPPQRFRLLRITRITSSSLGSRCSSPPKPQLEGNPLFPKVGWSASREQEIGEKKNGSRRLRPLSSIGWSRQWLKTREWQPHCLGYISMIALSMQGCDASILLDDTHNFVGEKTGKHVVHMLFGLVVGFSDEMQAERTKTCLTVMFADDRKSVVTKGVTRGAYDYLINPVRIEALKNIWRHVIRKRKNGLKDVEQSGSVESQTNPRRLIAGHRETSPLLAALRTREEDNLLLCYAIQQGLNGLMTQRKGRKVEVPRVALQKSQIECRKVNQSTRKVDQLTRTQLTSARRWTPSARRWHGMRETAGR
ncbi:hypothetical protein V8G54_018063 [Vigna mungo]|uniref:Uncharacterized protein n=1 Tax=Vigna mungo TaxID=3915 RepID=A0AAQ3N8Z1_VIGMU